MPGTTYRDTAYWVAPRSTRRTNKAQWRSTTSRAVRRTTDSGDNEDPDELVRSLGSPGCEWKEGMDAVNRFGTRYTALLCHLFQSGGLPGHLLQKILVVSTESDFAHPSVEPTVNWLCRPLMFKEHTGAHARECSSCRFGGPERLSLTAAKCRFRNVLTTMQTYLTLPRHLAWGAEISPPGLTALRTDCSISHLRSQVEMWEWATYQGLNGLLWRYAEAVNDVRSDWSRAVRSRDYDENDDRFRNEERAHAKTCLKHLRTVLLRTEEGSTHDRSLLDEVSYGLEHGADLWLLDHARSCSSCARHPTLNEALWTDDHDEDYKPWRNHPAWLDASAIQRNRSSIEDHPPLSVTPDTLRVILTPLSDERLLQPEAIAMIIPLPVCPNSEEIPMSTAISSSRAPRISTAHNGSGTNGTELARTQPSVQCTNPSGPHYCCKSQQAIESIEQFEAEYSALQTVAAQPDPHPQTDLMLKILALRASYTFSNDSINSQLHFLSCRPSLMAFNSKHRSTCSTMCRGAWNAMPPKEATARLESICASLQSYEELLRTTRDLGRKTQNTHPVERPECSVSCLRQQVDTLISKLYTELDAVVSEYLVDVEQLRCGDLRVMSKYTSERHRWSLNESNCQIVASKAFARLHGHKDRYRLESMHKDNHRMLRSILSSAGYKADLWLLEHAKQCGSCARHPTLNEQLLRDDHDEHYKPWRDHPVWADMIAIKKSVDELETVRMVLSGELRAESEVAIVWSP